MSLINLRQARKRRAKASAAKQADTNRIAHGLSAARRQTSKAVQKAQTRAVDAHKLDPTP